MAFQISVVIPAFNVEKYIKKAVASALAQSEVAEVLVIDDGSWDGTGEILESLQKEEPRVKLYTHPENKNRGRSASRNLGIKSACYDFVAFLDADDYYLGNRFKNDKQILEKNPEADGVYNAIGVHFYRKPQDKEEEHLKLTTMKKRVSPEELFWHKWPWGNHGNFHGNGLTLKRNAFKEVGYFNEQLKVAEDSELWIRMSLKLKLYPGLLNQAVAVRGVHELNVFSKRNTQLYFKNYFYMFSSLIEWGNQEKIEKQIISYFAQQRKKYFVKYMELDKQGRLSLSEVLFLYKILYKERKWKALLHFLPAYFGYKVTGKGYFLSKRFIDNYNL